MYSGFISRRDAEFLSEQDIPVEVIETIKEYFACVQITEIITGYLSKNRHTPTQRGRIKTQLKSILDKIE